MIKRYAVTLMGVAILIGVISVSLVSADTSYTIDFEGLNEGAIVSSLSCGSGITCPGGDPGFAVSVMGHNPAINHGNTNTAMIFDAECLPGGNAAGCSGGDTDLFFPGHGKTLIIAERLNSSNPDDGDVVGSFIEFDFSAFGPGGVTAISLDAGDIELSEGGAFVEGSDGACIGIESGLDDIPLPFTGNNKIQSVPLELSGVRCLLVHLNGSGTVDNIQFTVADAPAPSIDIEKATNGEDADLATGPVVLVGSTVNFTYVVTNTGNVDLTNVTVVDDQGVAVSCPQTTLAVGGSMTCTGSTTATAGQYANIGEACGNGAGQNVCDTDPSHHFGANPDINIEKATNGEDADLATGPVVLVGSTVNFTYLVTNTGNVDLTNVTVVDDRGVAVSCPQTILAVGGSMTCTGSTTATAGQYANIGEACGDGAGQNVCDTDPSHHFGTNPAIDIEKWTSIVAAPAGGDLCDTLEKPKRLTMLYTGNNILDHSQASGKVVVTGDPGLASPVQIISSENSDGTGDIYFDGTVNLGESFVIDATLAGSSALRSNTFVLINDLSGARLQTILFHTSCSQPMNLGDQFGGIQLVGFTDKNGNNSGTFDPAPDYGVDADTPTGPEGQVGDAVTWTYFVTNTGDVALANVDVNDDNGTPGDTSDDFDPAFVSGDTNNDGKLDIVETWLYQETGTIKLGQYANIGDVAGVDPNGTTVTDQDPSHHIGVFPAGDACDDGKPKTLTMLYTGGNILDHSQASGKVVVSGDPGSASPVHIIAADTADGTGRIFFEGNVELGESFVIDATERDLKGTTYVLIKDQAGNLLQKIEFHTSCSQPLELGNQFGGIQLVGFTAGDGEKGKGPKKDKGGKKG